MALENFLGPSTLVAIIDMNRHQNVPARDLAFVLLGLEFWDTQAYQGTGNAADSSTRVAVSSLRTTQDPRDGQRE